MLAGLLIFSTPEDMHAAASQACALLPEVTRKDTDTGGPKKGTCNLTLYETSGPITWML